MLVIRDDQMAVFARLFRDRFINETAELLRAERAEAVAGLPADRLRDRVAHAFDRAEAYGMRDDDALQHFTMLMFEFGPDFDDHPRVRAILEDPSIPADDRLDDLLEHLPHRVWEELLILADHAGWPDAGGHSDERG
ncbi:MAG: hypothetical protein ABSC95_26265 [Acetobacteraceae bacterium]|jgi:hypothetical protein